MASGQLVPKKMLIDQIRRTMIDGESGFFTILTDKKRSIMFRFSRGKLIHSHCRSRNVEEAINALNDCIELKFNHSNAQSKEQPEIIDAATFLQAIAPDDESVAPGPAPEPVAENTVTEQRSLIGKKQAPTEQAIPQAVGDTINPELQEQFCDVARDYIGMVANILVGDVFGKKLSADATIDEIAVSIPVPDHASAFRKRAIALVEEDKAAGEGIEKAPDHRLFF